MEESQIEEKRKIANRLKRASGQLNAIIQAVENGGSCVNVVTQLAAVSRALDRAGFAIIASNMRECLKENTQNGVEERLDAKELEKLFLMLA